MGHCIPTPLLVLEDVFGGRGLAVLWLYYSSAANVVPRMIAVEGLC